MTTTIPLNTVQKARNFLDTLGVAPAVYASSTEVLDALVAQVQRHRDDPAVRRMLAELVADLQHREDPARFPALTCETRDSAALARELSVLVGDGGSSRPDLRAAPAALGAVAALLLWSSTSLGCDPVVPGAIGGLRGPDAPVECKDLSAENFTELADQATDLWVCEIDEFAETYENLDRTTQAGVISDLCEMSPEDIATYLMNQFGDPDCDEQPWDDDDAYKGVTF